MFPTHPNRILPKAPSPVIVFMAPRPGVVSVCVEGSCAQKPVEFTRPGDHRYVCVTPVVFLAELANVSILAGSI